MRCARRWLCIALFASVGACADDHSGTDPSSTADSAAEQRDGAPGGSGDAASSVDAGGGSSSDAGGPSSDAGGSSSDAGASSGDAATARDAGSKDGGGGKDAGSSADGGASSKISCDPRRVLCDVVEPTCPENQVPSVKGDCYGPCVAIDECSCSDAPECPQPGTYTCHRSARHCGPYVN